MLSLIFFKLTRPLPISHASSFLGFYSSSCTTGAVYSGLLSDIDIPWNKLVGAVGSALKSMFNTYCEDYVIFVYAGIADYYCKKLKFDVDYGAGVLLFISNKLGSEEFY